MESTNTMRPAGETSPAAEADTLPPGPPAEGGGRAGTSSSGALPRHELLGFATNPGTLEEYLAYLAARVKANERCTVLYHNLHSLYSCFTDETLNRDYAGTTVLIDGMPVIWLMRACGLPVVPAHRITYVDFVLPLMRLARDNDWTVYHVGQDAQTQRRALETIRAAVPGIRIDGHCGYFDQTPGSPESLAVIEAMNRRGSRLVLVGFGAPRQEAWIAAHRDRIDAPAVLACGACMEYVAGKVATPPRWMGRFGLEWAYRLLGSPRRFAFRYGVEPLLLGVLLARNAVAARGLGRRVSGANASDTPTGGDRDGS